MNFYELAAEFRKQHDLDLEYHRAYLRAKQEKNKLLAQINELKRAGLGGDGVISGIGEFYYNKNLNQTTFVPEKN